MSTARPRNLVVVTGTNTEVGKTWLASGLLRELRRRGHSVAARKPAQSFEPPAPPGTTDAEILAAATGESAGEVCPPQRWYPKAMAPPMAAESLGRSSFGLKELQSELRWPAATTLGLVELAGGIGSPQGADGDGVDVVELLRPDLVVLVAPAGLGTLSNISLARRALGSEHLVVFLNRFDPTDELHVANMHWISERYGLSLTTELGELAGLLADHCAQL